MTSALDQLFVSLRSALSSCCHSERSEESPWRCVLRRRFFVADTPQNDRQTWSNVEQDVEHVAVADLVGLALQTLQAAALGLGMGARDQEVIARYDLGPDEAPLDIGVDAAGSLYYLRAGD